MASAGTQSSNDAKPVIVWFRDDLRVADNPALSRAAASGQRVVCLYVLDDESRGLRKLGGASRWWLAGSLRALADELKALGGVLVLRRGAAADVVAEVVREVGASAVYLNRRYDPAARAVDAKVAEALTHTGAAMTSFQASLLCEPWSIETQSGNPFSVYTPFARKLRSNGEPRAPLRKPKQIEAGPKLKSDDLDDWDLEPTKPDWAGEMRETWTRGEAGAHDALKQFLDHGLSGYAGHRDIPAEPHTSRLSPSLRFGEISPFQMWHAASHAQQAKRHAAPARDVERFHAELIWREFNHHILHNHPDLATKNFRAQFDNFPWLSDKRALRAWQRGQTGYPLVDAGMRQLWATGWMHNRVRLVVGSFLVKHLLIDWRKGEQWFWDTLVDADDANNPGNWQWVAGSGADASPYFRIFNPVLQGQKFDPEGLYVRRWVPELAKLPNDAIHTPFDAPASVLKDAGITLGKTYPKPLVDHQAARERALKALATVKLAAS